MGCLIKYIILLLISDVNEIVETLSIFGGNLQNIVKQFILNTYNLLFG